MKTFKSLTALLLSIILAFSCFGVITFAAPTIKSMKIVQNPTKLTYYKGTDWDYGYWQFSTETSDKGHFVEIEDNICFMHNGGYYSNMSDIGMVDMTGLVIEVTYSDGSTKKITYKETFSGNKVTQNIYFSLPKKLSVGSNTVEIFLPENYYVYTSFTINLVTSTTKKGDINGDGVVNSADALKVLRHVVGSATLTGDALSFADVNVDKTINSLDALEILKIAVGK